jgi:hypothetical protein
MKGLTFSWRLCLFIALSAGASTSPFPQISLYPSAKSVVGASRRRLFIAACAFVLKAEGVQLEKGQVVKAVGNESDAVLATPIQQVLPGPVKLGEDLLVIVALLEGFQGLHHGHWKIILLLFDQLRLLIIAFSIAEALIFLSISPRSQAAAISLASSLRVAAV